MPTNDKPPLLLVDDESEIINVLQMMFTQKGQPVIVANSGSAALELLNKRVNDLTTHYVRAIVSDWMMPNLNGLELLAKVRSTEALKGIPFVLMSGNVTKDELLAAVRYDLDTVTKAVRRANQTKI